MRAIILAAGAGTRLQAFNPDGRPKALFEFNGESVLSRQLARLIECGIGEVELVLGYQADRVIEHVSHLSQRPDVKFAYCPDYSKGSAYTLLAAGNSLSSGDGCLVMDSDLLFESELLQRFLADPQSCSVAIDVSTSFRAGLISVQVTEGRVDSYKEPETERKEATGSAVAFGLTRLDSNCCDRIVSMGNEFAGNIQLVDYPGLLHRLAQEHPGQLGTVDVTGLAWQKLVTPDDIGDAIRVVMADAAS